MNYGSPGSKRASESLFRTLQDQILQGLYKPGEKLPTERELMVLFCRSHATVREALRLLESAGYIHVVQGGGIYVREPGYRVALLSFQRLMILRKVPARDVLDFFSRIGPRIAELAAERRTEDDLTELEEALCGILKQDGSQNGFYESILRFQTGLADASHNPVISMIWHGAMEILPRGPEVERDINLSNRVPKEHKRLLDCIRERDADGAALFSSRCWVLNNEIRRSLTLEQGQHVTAVTGRKRSEEVFRELLRQILIGELEPGDRLPPERALAETFDCSRPMIREALKMLELRSLLRIVQGSGSYVNEFTTDGIDRAMWILEMRGIVTPGQIFEFRYAAGRTVAGLAAARRTAGELAGMEQALREARANLSDRKLFVPKILEFKRLMAASSHNEMIRILNDMTVLSHLKESEGRLTFPPEMDQGILEQCEAICGAIGRHAVEEASRIDLEHLAYVARMTGVEE